MKERLILSAQEADTDAMMLKDTSKANPNQLQLFATAEYPAQSKEMTLNDKLRPMRSIYPDAAVIRDIGSGIDFKRKGLRTLLERLMRGDKLQLLLPIGIDSPASVSTLYDTLLNKTVANSWFWTKQNTVTRRTHSGSSRNLACLQLPDARAQKLP